MRSRFVRRLLTCATVGGAGLGVAVIALVWFVAWLGTDAGNRFLGRQIEGRVAGMILSEGAIELGEIHLDWRSGLLVRDFRMVSGAGRPVLQIGELVADLDLGRTLTSFVITVPHLRATGIVFDMTIGEDGVSDLSRMFGGPKPVDPEKEDKPFSLPVSFSGPDVVLDGVHVRITRPEGVAFQLGGAEARTAITGLHDRITVSGLELGAHIARPGPIPVTANGGFTYDAAGVGFDHLHVRVPYGDVEAHGLQRDATDAMDFAIRIAALDARALTPIAPDAGIGGSVAGAFTVKGPRRALAVTAGIHGEGETTLALQASAELDLDAEVPTYGAVAELDEVHVEHVVTALGEPIVLDGVIRVDGRGFSFPDELTLEGTWRGERQEIYGQVLDRVDTAFALDEGVLTLRHAEVSGIVGEIAAKGTLDLARGPLAVTVHVVPDSARLASLGAEGIGGACAADAEVTMDLKAEPLVIRAPGTLQCAPFRYTDDVTIANLTAGFDTTVAGADVGVGIDLSGTGIEAYGATARTMSSDDLFVHVPAGGDPIAVDGTFAVDALAVGTAASVTTTTTELSVRSGESLTVDVQTTLGEFVIGDRPGTAGVATIALRDETIGFGAVLEDLGRTILDAEGTFDTASQRIVVDHALLAPTPRIVFTDRGPWSLTLIDGGVTDAAVVLTGTLGTVELLGTVSTSGTSNATVSVDDLQLDIIAELFPEQASDVAGALDLDLTLTGSAADPTIGADLALTGLFVPGAVRWLDIRGKLQVADHTLSPDLELGVAGDPFGRISGTAPLTGGLTAPGLAWDQPADIVAAITPGALERFATLLPALTDTELPVGVLSAALRVRGPLDDPDLHLSGITEVAVQGWTAPGRVEVVVVRVKDELTVYADLREGLASRASIVGDATTRMGEVFAWATGNGPEVNLDDYTLWADDFTVNAMLLGLPVESIATATAAPIEIEGDLVGGFVVTGSPMTPTIQGAVNWLDPELGGQPLEGGYLELVPAEDFGYRLALSVAFADGSLEIAGAVPVEVDLAAEPESWAKGDLDLAITGTAVPVSVIAAFDQGVEEPVGAFDFEGHVGGSVFDPEPALTLTGKDVALVYTPLNLRIHDTLLTVDFDRTRVQIDLAAATEPASGFSASDLAGVGTLEGGQPRLTVKGTTQLEEWTPTGVSAEIAFVDGAWLTATSDAKLRVDGELDVGGSWPALTIDGSIAVPRAGIVLDAATFASASPLEPDPLLVIHRPGVEIRPPEPEEPPVYADFVVDVALDLSRNLELGMELPFVDDFGQLGALFTTMYLKTRFGGQVDLHMEGGEPSLVGELEVIDGSVQVLSSDLVLEEGTIVFSGGDPSENANLDLTARMDVEGATLEMHIGGTPYAPEVELRSDEYPDETSQITMLLTGQAPGDLSAEEGASALAGVFVGGMLGGPGLGAFSIDASGAATVTVPVNRRVRATTMIDPFPDPIENQYAVTAEWTMSRQVVAVGMLGDVVSSVDLFWEIRF